MSSPFRLLAGTLSLTIFAVGCAGPQYQYAAPLVFSESEWKACDEFARQTIELETTKANTAANAGRPRDWGNDIGAILFALITAPVWVPATAILLPFGGSKEMAKDPARGQLERRYDVLMAVCVRPLVVAHTLGPHHPEMAEALIELAREYSYADRVDDADSLYQQALAIQEEAFGPSAPRVADGLTAYAAFLRRTGRESQAEAVLDRVRAIWNTEGQETSPDPGAAAVTPVESGPPDPARP